MFWSLYSLSALGASFICYGISCLINNLSIYYKESGKDNFLVSCILPWLYLIFRFLGFVPALIIHFTRAYPDRLAEAAVRKEEREFMEKICKSEVDIAVKAEHDRLVNFYRDYIEDRCEAVRREERDRFHNFFSEYLREKRESLKKPEAPPLD